MKKMVVRILANSAIGVVLVVVWSRFVDLDQILRTLRAVQLKFILPFFALFALSGALRGLRLKLLLNDFKLPFKDLMMLTYLSQLLSFMIPLRAGELTKSVYLTSQFDLPLKRTIIWILLDRFIDFWILLLLIALLSTMVTTQLPVSLIRTILLVSVLTTLLLISAVKSKVFLPKLVKFLSNFLIFSSIKRPFESFSNNILEGLEVLHQNFLRLIILSTLSTVAAFSDGSAWFLIFLSLGQNLGVIKAVLGNSLLAFTFLIPAAPGYVGSAEAAVLGVFGVILGLSNNLASAGGILFHLLAVVTLMIYGITSLYFLKFDLRLVWKKLRGRF